MLDICSVYAEEYNALFNSTKSKLIVNKYHKYAPISEPNVMFMGGKINVVNYEKLLSNIIGNINTDYNTDIFNASITDFMMRVNMVKYNCNGLPVDKLYFLFKRYCMSLYGSQLWDLSNPRTDKLYLSWQKAVRFLFNNISTVQDSRCLVAYIIR